MGAVSGTSIDGTPAVGGTNSATIQANNTNWPAAGVSGTATQNGVGVIGFGNTGIGVWGHSKSSTGVGGVSDTAIGMQGISNGSNTGVAVGVQGNSSAGRGVAGFSDSFQGVYGYSKTQAGVVGESNSFDGVFGIAHNPSAAGVSGHNPGGLAGYFDGNVTVTGNVNVAGDVILTGNDCAEQFDIADVAAGPGTVMVFDDSECLLACTEAYDRRVAGVVSGAGGYRPGIILRGPEPAANRRPIALIGRVFCKVDASYGAIEAGDLLTTSPNPGHAMKAADSSKASGTTIGKALRSQQLGQGLIPILVALQ